MQRKPYLDLITAGFRTGRLVAILGPRQCGKTTLAREYFNKYSNANSENYFDLEDPTDLSRLQDPKLALEDLDDLIVIDEVQRSADLFPVLRVLVDQPNCNKKFLILGSASRELIRQSSESLAGRISYIELHPFSLQETGNAKKLWLRGGFPLSYLAATDQDSMRWRKNYIKTFLEQDIPNLGIKIPTENIRRFWMMLAHYHGQLLNASELGNALDLSHHTIKKYLDILTGTFMIRQLQPWHENIAKRQVKSTKIYFRDSGILHTLADIHSHRDLLINPKIGASWEGFALETIIDTLQAEPGECYFWSIHNGAELDLLFVRGTKRYGYEFKHTKTPKLTRSMQTAYENLNLDKLRVIYPGDKKIRLHKNIDCIGLEQYESDIL